MAISEEYCIPDKLASESVKGLLFLCFKTSLSAKPFKENLFDFDMHENEHVTYYNPLSCERSFARTRKRNSGKRNSAFLRHLVCGRLSGCHATRRGVTLITETNQSNTLSELFTHCMLRQFASVLTMIGM